MARSRNIKPGFFRNELLVELPFEYRLLFIGLWTMADREGRFEDRPTKIRMEVFPADDVDVDIGLQALHDNGFIRRYMVDGQRYCQVLAWAKHQNPHHREVVSTIPGCVEPEASLGLAPEIPGSAVLIPDSLNLIPDSLQEIAPAPQTQLSPAKEKKGPVTFSSWYSSIPTDVAGVPDTHAVFRYARDVGLPDNFLELAWAVFEDKFVTATKRQKDWPGTFANYVKNNYLKLWWLDGDTYALSSTGRQALIAFERDALNSFEKMRPSNGDVANLTEAAA